ncbi:hypothetical protein [Gemmatimonas phototrophica]|uniref:Uncharacterized protein n=1 Tax=Gemmatimonas phototrophica TaxID=1379270 RepID=A0A143BFW6_9BACT|nr:hypothetical protein [Gemmatimonas phototrophica]AMW03918.1 hypothetical protein GEMMAAP_01790 [Gemmatimonas phototrophica]
MVLALPVWLQGCDDTVNAADEAPPALRAALAARTVYPAKREEWRTDITSYTDSTMEPRVFRASQATVALLQASPTRISLFELNRKGMLLSTRPARIDSVLNAQVPRDIVLPTELSRVTDDGQVDIIDSASSILMRESIGGFMFRRDLPLLRGGSGRLCTVSPATLLHVRVLGERRTLEAFTLTAIAADDVLKGRHRFVGTPGTRLRFGTGDARRCLLLTEREVLVVSAPDAPGAGVPPRLAPLRAPGAAAPMTIDQMSPGASRDSANVLQPFIVDAAIVDGGFVVLVGIESDRQGRILDYYNERGDYLQSAMLPFTASAMTGSGPRFLALHQDTKFRWWLSSWLTPMAARGATPPPEPRQINATPGRQLFELPRRSAKP